MSIFSRIFKVGQAKVNKVVDKLEKPELMLEQAIRDKEKQIKEAKKSVMQCIATERQTKSLIQKDKADQLQWEQKAESALKAGKEELAVKALNRSSEHEQKAAALEGQWQTQRSSVDALKQDISKMDDELAEFKRNKDFIIAQSRAADVKKQIYQAKANMSKDSSPDDLMARLKAKAERSGLEADAAKEMADSFSGGDSLDKEFEQLGTTTASVGVHDKLAALKAKMGN
ncbi:MAG: PspA/IM30 family protein [Desulfobulbaceae bacterium]|nr:PspA/IM30 family protein [Desulfobulbaceae bacterium]MCK5437501.1 PspA/IM30 family protein [Desulfobulbaceae bacterium]